MKTEAFIKEIIIYRNVDADRYYRFTAVLADKNPDGKIPTFDYVEKIRIEPQSTTIMVYDLDRPVFYELPDGTRRKVHYVKKKK